MLIYINHYLYIIMIERIPQLKNRDYDATYRENGTPCPKNTGSKYSDHNVNDEAYGNRTHCDNCLLCKQQVVQANSKESCGVMCMWRDEPPFPPLYHIDEEKWYIYTYCHTRRKKIRKIEWSKTEGCWKYTFSRDQNSVQESYIFDTRKEVDEYILLCRISSTMRDIQEHQKQYGSLPGSLKNLLLTAGNNDQPC